MAQAVILLTAISSPLTMTQKAYILHSEVLLMESARKHLISVGRKLQNSLLTLFNMINISRRKILTAVSEMRRTKFPAMIPIVLNISAV